MGGNVSFTHYDSREQDTEGGTSNANIFYASNIMGQNVDNAAPTADDGIAPV